MSIQRSQIERILANSEFARNSDNELLIEILNLNGANLTQHQQSIMREFSFESVTRARRKFQEEGKYLPNEIVARRRRLKSYIVQQNIPKTPAEKVEPLVSQQPRAIPWFNEGD